MLKRIDWEGAIKLRRSTRSYEMAPVEQDKLEQLQQFSEQMEMPFEHRVQIRWFKANPDKKLYTVFASPPDNVAFLANTDTCSLATVGFVGEVLILYATSLGLATCWYGHYALAELESVMPHLGAYGELPHPKWGYGKEEVAGERAVCISPVGYWQQGGVRFFDRMQETLISHKRKPLATFLEGEVQEADLSPEIRSALELACKAPSAANSQHWRFKVSADCKKITIAMPVGYKHLKWEHPNVDIGICAAHFWLGLLSRQIDCTVSLQEAEGRALWQFEL